VAEPPLWIVSDAEGLILDVSPDAAHLLNASVRGLYQRSLILFFDRDRDHWQRALVRAALGERVIEAGLLRPKDRGPVPVGVAIQAVHDWTRPAVQWEFQRQ
jgi:predicted RNA polymerase sigma factor